MNGDTITPIIQTFNYHAKFNTPPANKTTQILYLPRHQMKGKDIVDNKQPDDMRRRGEERA